MSWGVASHIWVCPDMLIEDLWGEKTLLTPFVLKKLETVDFG